MAVNRCPACSRVYDDAGLKFCPDDGMELVPTTGESEVPPTAVMSGSENNVRETIEASTARKTSLLMVGIIMVVVAVAVIIMSQNLLSLVNPQFQRDADNIRALQGVVLLGGIGLLIVGGIISAVGFNQFISPQRAIPSTVAVTGAANRSLVPLLITVVVLLLIGAIILVTYMVLPAGDNIFSYFLTRTARRLPMLLLALGGIVFALMRWKLNPRASLMTVAALGIYLVDMVVYTLILYWLPSIVEPMRMSTSASRFFYSVVYFIEDIVMAVTIILLVAAAFANRQSTPGSKII